MLDVWVGMFEISKSLQNEVWRRLVIELCFHLLLNERLAVGGIISLDANL